MKRGEKRSQTSVANGKRLAAAGKTFHHSVYVILLGSGRASPSIDPASEPESRPGEALRLRRDDRTAGRAALRESQERRKIGLDRKKVRPPLDA
jgi:hypothetical protein